MRMSSAQRLHGRGPPQRWGTLFLVGLREASTILCLQYRSGGEDKYTRGLSIVLAGSTDVAMGRRQMGLKTGQGVLVELPGCFDAQSERPTWPRGSLRDVGLALHGGLLLIRAARTRERRVTPASGSAVAVAARGRTGTPR